MANYHYRYTPGFIGDAPTANPAGDSDFPASNLANARRPIRAWRSVNKPATRITWTLSRACRAIYVAGSNTAYSIHRTRSGNTDLELRAANTDEVDLLDRQRKGLTVFTNPVPVGEDLYIDIVANQNTTDGNDYYTIGAALLIEQLIELGVNPSRRGSRRIEIPRITEPQYEDGPEVGIATGPPYLVEEWDLRLGHQDQRDRRIWQDIALLGPERVYLWDYRQSAASAYLVRLKEVQINPDLIAEVSVRVEHLPGRQSDIAHADIIM